MHCISVMKLSPITTQIHSSIQIHESLKQLVNVRSTLAYLRQADYLESAFSGINKVRMIQGFACVMVMVHVNNQ